MKFFKKLSFVLAVFTGAAIMISCEGPEGPAGPKGADGADGSIANMTCTECHHDDTDLLARQIQYQKSGHFVNGNFERSGATCSACHTHEGFMEALASGSMATAAVNQPTPPNCRTCHEIHETYTQADYALTATADFEFNANPGVQSTLGESNLCAHCHQARPANPPLPNPGESVTLANNHTRWGPHYSTQSQFLLAVGAHAFNGSAGSTSSHKNAACITCHMATPFGGQAGGHNMSVAYDYHGSTEILTTGCVDCHDDPEAKISGFLDGPDGMLAKIEELKQLLIDKQIYNPDNNLARPGTYPYDVAMAYWNYRYIYGEGSHGIHNPRYAKDIINQSIAKLKE